MIKEKEVKERLGKREKKAGIVKDEQEIKSRKIYKREKS